MRTIRWVTLVCFSVVVLALGCGKSGPANSSKPAVAEGAKSRGLKGGAGKSAGYPDITHMLYVTAYENGDVEFSFMTTGQHGGGVPDLPVSKFPEAMATFRKFLEWRQISEETHSDPEKELPNPWGKMTFHGNSGLSHASLDVGYTVRIFGYDDIAWFADVADHDFDNLVAQAKQDLASKKQAGDLLK